MMFKQIFHGQQQRLYPLSAIRSDVSCHMRRLMEMIRGTIKQRSVLQMVQDQLRLRWFFKEEDIEMAGPLPSAEDLRGNAWKFCHVDRRHGPSQGMTRRISLVTSWWYIYLLEKDVWETLSLSWRRFPLPSRATRVIIFCGCNI